MIATLVASSSAASIYPRQNAIACNVARFQIVAALAQTGNSVDKIQDQTVATAAQAGLDNASAGIGQIAKAILTGAAPPADARDQTAAGITAATQALGGGDASDSAVVSAQSSIADAATAGKAVLANC